MARRPLRLRLHHHHQQEVRKQELTRRMIYDLTSKIGPGVPPPPPPPPGPGGPGAPAAPVTGPLRKELKHYPNIQLKHLQWQKLDVRKIDKTIWLLEEVNEDELEEMLATQGIFGKIEDLFPAKVNLFFERKLKAKIEERKDAVKFLTKEKTRNINLAILPKVKNMTFKEVRRHIINMDDDLCNETFVTNLISFAPSKDDKLDVMEKYIKASEEERLELDEPEQFTVEVRILYLILKSLLICRLTPTLLLDDDNLSI